MVIARSHVALAAALVAALAGPAGAIELVANFSGGNSTDVPDGFVGRAGSGWTTPWETYESTAGATTAAVLMPGDAGFNEIDGGGAYLAGSVPGTVQACVSRSYSGALDMTLPHSIEFTLRIDENVTTSFTHSNDRYTLFDAPGLRGGSDASCSWIIGAYGGSTTWVNPADVGYWLFYNGLNDGGGFLAAQQVNSNIAIHQGGVYRFQITVDPATKKYDATITEGAHSFTANGLGWRTSAATVAGRPQISARGSATGDLRMLSLDRYRITGTALAPHGGLSSVSAHFTGGNSDSVVDAYVGMAGDGWRAAWVQGTSGTTLTPLVLAPGDLGFTSEVKPGSGAYLSVAPTHTSGTGTAAVMRNYRTTATAGIDWAKDHTIRFSLRIDEDVDNEWRFLDFDDRYHVFDASTVHSNTGADCTWLISAYAAAGEYVAEDVVGEWSFYNGNRDSGAPDITRNVGTDIALHTGGVYDFTVVVHPETQSYDATVSDGTTSFTANGLGWRSASSIIGGYVAFTTRSNAADDLRAFSLDDLVITQEIQAYHAGDANGDGKVDDLDASILAANWQRTGGATWAQADFNSDGNVNDLDASILAANWQYGVGSAVPEPGTLALLLAGVAGLAFLGRRGR